MSSNQPVQVVEPKDQAEAQPVKKKARNRRFSKVVLSETDKELILNVKHTPYKGEKLSDTRRKDHKVDLTQRFYAGRPL